MAKPDEPHCIVAVETYRISGSGLHGAIHVRPVNGEQFPQTLHVRFAKKLRCAHPVDTRFRIDAKLTSTASRIPTA